MKMLLQNEESSSARNEQELMKNTGCKEKTLDTLLNLLYDKSGD